jgi:hypothetical protein
MRDLGDLTAFVSTPGVLSLFGVIYQLVRDEAAYVKQLALQSNQQRFDLGVTSHMANVAFDKHAIFCEEYVAELHATLRILIREYATALALTQANKLVAIRIKHSVWLTADIESKLEPIDLALRKMGATAWLQGNNPSAAVASGRLEEMHDLFADVVGLQKEEGKAVDEAIAITSILEKVREILGVRQLTELRQRLLKQNAPVVEPT